jgi:DNA repair photolyase
MAAESPVLQAKSRVEYLEIAARSFVSEVPSERVPFRYGINPYRGCEFGCKYCYARYAHEFMELRDPLDFERRIFVKQFDAAAFREELRRLPVGESIAIGTATDPYQPAERRYGVTRAMLEVFAQTAGFHVGITTKSQLVARDLDVLREMSRRHYVTVSMTVTTADAELARALEPMAPRPDLRLAAVRKLVRGDVRATVFCAPIMPLINDSDAGLDALARAAAAAGANGFGGNVVFLKDSAKAVFLPFLEERFPGLVRRYRERFERTAFLRGDYPERIRERVGRIRRRYGFEERFETRQEPELWPREAQMGLFEEDPASVVRPTASGSAERGGNPAAQLRREESE